MKIGLKCRHLPVVDERVHEDLLLDDLLELWLLVDEVAVVVVAHHDCVRLRRQVQDELVVVADDAPPAHLPRRRERQQPLLLQLRQQVLICRLERICKVKATKIHLTTYYTLCTL